jgi:hypothetical protein
MAAIMSVNTNNAMPTDDSKIRLELDQVLRSLFETMLGRVPAQHETRRLAGESGRGCPSMRSSIGSFVLSLEDVLGWAHKWLEG